MIISVEALCLSVPVQKTKGGKHGIVENQIQYLLYFQRRQILIESNLLWEKTFLKILKLKDLHPSDLLENSMKDRAIFSGKIFQIVLGLFWKYSIVDNDKFVILASETKPKKQENTFFFRNARTSLMDSSKLASGWGIRS